MGKSNSYVKLPEGKSYFVIADSILIVSRNATWARGVVCWIPTCERHCLLNIQCLSVISAALQYTNVDMENPRYLAQTIIRKLKVDCHIFVRLVEGQLT